MVLISFARYTLSNANRVCNSGYNRRHNYHPFCVLVALIINITCLHYFKFTIEIQNRLRVRSEGSLSMIQKDLYILELEVIHDSAKTCSPPNHHPDTRKSRQIIIILQTGSIAKVRHLFFTGFTNLLVLARQ